MRLSRAHAAGCRGPFADAVDRQNGRVRKWRREERTGGVRLVVLGEYEPLAVAAKAGAQVPRNV